MGKDKQRESKNFSITSHIYNVTPLPRTIFILLKVISQTEQDFSLLVGGSGSSTNISVTEAKDDGHVCVSF